MRNIPTITQLYNEILTDLQTELDVVIPVWGKNFLRAMAAVQAAKLKIYYLGLGSLQKNIFVDTADSEKSGGTLERFGRVKIGRNPFPATQGKYNVTVTGVVGATIPAQTTFKSDDTAQNPGMMFILDIAYTLVAVSDTITLRALVSGTGSRLQIGDTLTATAPIINVDSGAVVSAEVDVPNSAEDIELYRKVVIDSYRLEPQGGASADYRIWGHDASGVKEIYPYAASAAPNEINVFVEATVVDSTDGMGTPTVTILDDVTAAIEADPITGRGRRPLGVFAVHTLPVVVNKVSIVITGYQGLTPAKEALLFQGLSEAIANVRPFIAGADILANKNDVLGNNNIINIILSTIPGSDFSSVEMTIQIGAGTPTVEANKIFDNGNIPFLTAVTYV